MTMPPIGLISLFCTLAVFAPPAFALPIRDIPDLESLTFWERTGGSAPSAYTFDFDSTALTERLPDPLNSGNSDFSSFSAEHFDVFYSDADGEFNIDGEYVTVECVVTQAGSGCNLAAVALNFTDAAQELANRVMGFVALGDSATPGTVNNAIDGDLQTHARLGNTIGQSSRLRLTLRFASASLGDLESVTFWERTGGSSPTAYTFDFDSTELTERLLDPLHSGNSDFSSFSAEHFDVFYSDGNGGFNINGEYITIECVVTVAGSGGNIAEVTLNFTDTSQEFGGQVVSFVTLGATPEPDSVSRAIDQDLQTHARLGDTIGQSSRLRLTLGFPSLSPSTTIFNDGFETGNLLAWSSVQ